MKTFEEALQMFYREVPVGPDDDHDALEAKHGGEMEEGLARINATMNEIIFSAPAQRFVQAMRQIARKEPNYSVLTLALHAFAHGVAVGMQMERRDDYDGLED